MKQVLLILLSYFPILTFAQITFEKGYFIKNNDEKVECLIYDEGWKNNPIEIEFKTSEEDEVKKITIKEMKEFGINDISKFIRFKGNVDVSGNTTSRYSEQKKPEFEIQTVFLKVLLEGTVNLYHYNNKQVERFYYQMSTGKIEPLIYKTYLIEKDGIKLTTTNTKYKRQLLINMKCESMTMEDVNKLSYSKKSLIDYFVKYHECLGEAVTVFSHNKYKVHLALELGYTAQTFDFRNTLFYSEWQTNGYAPRFGLQTEVILPFNKNKWSIFLGANYQYMNAKDSVLNPDPLSTLMIKRAFELNYQSIECNLGFRYYMFLNQNSKFFIDVAYIADLPFSSSITATGDFGVQSSLDIGINAGLGIGYQYKKIALTLRYHTSRDMIRAVEQKTAYSTTGITLRYYLF